MVRSVFKSTGYVYNCMFDDCRGRTHQLELNSIQFLFRISHMRVNRFQVVTVVSALQFLRDAFEMAKTIFNLCFEKFENL